MLKSILSTFRYKNNNFKRRKPKDNSEKKCIYRKFKAFHFFPFHSNLEISIKIDKTLKIYIPTSCIKILDKCVITSHTIATDLPYTKEFRIESIKHRYNNHTV